MATRDDILRFWFGDTIAADAIELSDKIRRWYMGGAREDAAIRERFAAAVERAFSGEFGTWADTARGRLALILLLDQMPRALFRGTARAFLGDARAQRLACEMLDAGTDRELTFEQCHFVYMPLLHAESAALLDRYNDRYPKAVALAPEWGRALLGHGVDQGLKYRDVVRRFGRFPHRNTALARSSTADEIEFLKTWDHRATWKTPAA